MLFLGPHIDDIGVPELARRRHLTAYDDDDAPSTSMTSMKQSIALLWEELQLLDN